MGSKNFPSTPKNCPPTPRWLCSTCNLDENDMKMLVGIFSNALYTYAPRCRKFPKTDGWGWVYKSNRSHLRVLLVKHTNISILNLMNNSTLISSKHSVT